MAPVLAGFAERPEGRSVKSTMTTTYEKRAALRRVMTPAGTMCVPCAIAYWQGAVRAVAAGAEGFGDPQQTPCQCQKLSLAPQAATLTQVAPQPQGDPRVALRADRAPQGILAASSGILAEAATAATQPPLRAKHAAAPGPSMSPSPLSASLSGPKVQRADQKRRATWAASLLGEGRKPSEMVRPYTNGSYLQPRNRVGK